MRSASITSGIVILIGAAALLAGCANHSRAAGPGRAYRVEPDCGDLRNCYTTLQGALDASASEPSDAWVFIDVGAGLYEEKVTIRRPKTRLHGAGVGRSSLRFDAVAETSAHYHRDHWGTPGSATLTIDADQVIVEDMTIENGYDYLANDALADGDPRKIANCQAVALLLDVHSDRVLVQRSSVIGFQDTLFADGKRALIRDSLISGNVDFIFGSGQLLIEDSTVRSRRRAAVLPPSDIQSIVAAPSTPSSQRMGIVFFRSRLTREAGVPDGTVALARPWHPTRRFPDGRYADPNAIGQASYIDCFMEAHIHRDHWTSMLGTARDGTKTQVFRPQDARFFESGSRGPGARHVDIGMQWAGDAIDALKELLLADWPEARQPGR